MKRREFLKTSITASTLAGLGAATLPATSQAADASGAQEYYELRAYHLKSDDHSKLLLSYLEKAAIPAWNKLGIKPIGVFTQEDRTQKQNNDEARDPLTVFVLIPYASLDVFATAAAHQNADADYQKNGHEYLSAAKDNPSFQRIDSWLMLAFAGLPKIELAPYSVDKTPRIFELRTYESHSELKALKKVEMFNSGEIQVMRDVGLAPVFYGQALIGPNLPHLTYMTSAASDELHAQHWGAFGKHPVWNKLNKDPQYADTVSKITRRFLVPAACSQI